MAGRVKKAPGPKKNANGYKMPAPIPVGEVIHNTIVKKKWRIGPSIGVGGFGEIYSACDHESSPKKGSNYPLVVKIVSTYLLLLLRKLLHTARTRLASDCLTLKVGSIIGQ